MNFGILTPAWFPIWDWWKKYGTAQSGICEFNTGFNLRVMIQILNHANVNWKVLHWMFDKFGFVQWSTLPKVKYFLNEIDIDSINEYTKYVHFTPFISPTPTNKNVSVSQLKPILIKQHIYSKYKQLYGMAYFYRLELVTLMVCKCTGFVHVSLCIPSVSTSFRKYLIFGDVVIDKTKLTKYSMQYLLI